MTECGNETMRDLLPLLAQGALAGEAAARVRAHVAGCAACASELRILEAAGAMFAAATPPVDTAAILRALPAAAGTRPALRLERGAPRRPRMPRYALAAAASILLVATISLSAVLRNFNSPTVGTGVDTVVDSGIRASAAVPVDMLGADALQELGADELATLLAELETMEATVAAEPNTLRQPVTSTPEGL
jgi:hypothetical protein